MYPEKRRGREIIIARIDVGEKKEESMKKNDSSVERERERVSKKKEEEQSRFTNNRRPLIQVNILLLSCLLFFMTGFHQNMERTGRVRERERDKEQISVPCNKIHLLLLLYCPVTSMIYILSIPSLSLSLPLSF